MSDPFEIPVGDEQEQSRDFSDTTVDWMNPVPQRYYRKFETDALGYRLKGVVRYDLEDGFSVEFEDYNPVLFDEEDVEALGERLIEIERKAFLLEDTREPLYTYYLVDADRNEVGTFESTDDCLMLDPGGSDLLLYNEEDYQKLQNGTLNDEEED